MAGKARRAAARQGQLTRKRKKSQRGPSGIPSTTVVDNEPRIGSAVDGAGDTAEGQENGATDVDGVAAPEPVPSRPNRPYTAPKATAANRSSRLDSAPQGTGRIRGERPAAYNYVGAELRRIGTFSFSIIAVLIVLGIVL